MKYELPKDLQPTKKEGRKMNQKLSAFFKNFAKGFLFGTIAFVVLVLLLYIKAWLALSLP